MPEATAGDLLVISADAKGIVMRPDALATVTAMLCGVFDEAERRDPLHQRTWVALVDGNNHQIDRVNAEAAARGIDVTIVVDLIHVLEYLWAAAWCFFKEADPAAHRHRRHRGRLPAPREGPNGHHGSTLECRGG